MKLVFNFNPDTHHFWPIYEAIIKYYPIGLRRDEQSILFDYPGMKALSEIVASVIHKENDFYQSWLWFEKELAEVLGVTHQGTTMGQAPSLSTEIILEKTETVNHVLQKKLSVNLSLVGKFYTIYGIDDSTYVKHQEGSYTHHYNAINAITTSPFQEFDQPFKKAKEILELRFPGYKYVPFMIYSSIINGLRVRYSDKEVCTIYDALFNGNLDRINEYCFRRGDTSYGYDDWRIPNTEQFDIQVSISAPPPII